MSDSDDPQHWLGSSPLLDLEDTKLRLRVQSLTQLCKNERESALAIYGFVKRIPFSKPFKMRLHTAREVIDQGRGDSADKATLLVAMLRLAQMPARIRYLTLRGEVMRGLLSGMPEPTRPVVEVLRNGEWLGTDTYIFDAAYLAAARRRMEENGWDWGYGIHAKGATLWDGNASAYVGGPRADWAHMIVEDHGLYCDPLEYVSSESYRARHGRLSRALQWNVFSPAMERAIRDLRADPDTSWVLGGGARP
jgi:transglutaminase-like putative cysteine protease